MGGAQRYVLDLVRYFKEKNNDICVCSGETGPMMNEMESISIKTHIFHNLVREIHFVKDFLCLIEIYNYIRAEKPDIVHLNSSKAGVLGAIAARIAGVKKIIYTVHGFVFLEPMPKWKKKLYIWAEKFSSRFKDAIICVSDYDRKAGIKYKIAPEQKLMTIHNGIDSSRLNFLPKDEARRELLKTYNLPASPAGRQLTTYNLIIGTIANFYPTKGLVYLIGAAKEILKKYPDTLFIIIGDGMDRKSLEDEITKNNLSKNIILTGQIKNASQYLMAFDIYVSSSVKEGLPYSIMEAMAAGLPIVSTNVGGIPELLNAECGILVEPKNVYSIASELEKIIADPLYRKKLGENAKKFAQSEFSFNAMLYKTNNAYAK